MLVHRKKRPRYKLQMPLTSLIDIVFLLLIYFLLTTNFMVAEGINVSLPQAQGGPPRRRRTSLSTWTGRDAHFCSTRKSPSINSSSDCER